MAIKYNTPFSGVGDATAAAVTVTALEQAVYASCIEFWEATSISIEQPGLSDTFVWWGRKRNTPLTPAWSSAPTILENAINTSFPALRFVSNGALIVPATAALLTPGADYSVVAIVRNPTGTAGSGTIVGNARDAGTDGYFALQARADLSVRCYHESSSGSEIDQAAVYSADTWTAITFSYDQSEADLIVQVNGVTVASNTSVGAEITSEAGGNRLMVGSSGSAAQAAPGNHDLAGLYLFDVPILHADHAAKLTAVEGRITEARAVAFS